MRSPIGRPPRTVRAARVRRHRAVRGYATRLSASRPPGDAGGHIAPQGDHQLAGHGDDPDLPRPFAFPEPRPIPLSQGTVRLPPHPIPGELDADRLEARIPGATDPCSRAGSPLSYGGGLNPSNPPISAAILKPRQTKPSSSRTSALVAPPFQLHQAPQRTPRPVSADALWLGRARRAGPPGRRAATRPGQPRLQRRRQLSPRPIPHRRPPDPVRCRGTAVPHVASHPRI